VNGQEHIPGKHADKDRRRIVKAVLASSPIIATITSKPVQAVQGLSNMLSGNASTCRGDNRYGGMSPGFWKTPHGTTDAPYGDPHEAAWQLTGLEYGKKMKDKKGNKWEHFSGGTRYIDVFGSNIPDSERPLRQVLNEDNGSEQFHLIAGLLNARYYERKSGGQTEYIFTEAQFWDLYHGKQEIPDSYSSLRDLIESNYHQGPNSDCGITVNGNDT
jgi:hypothetical protein